MDIAIMSFKPCSWYAIDIVYLLCPLCCVSGMSFYYSMLFLLCRGVWVYLKDNVIIDPVFD